MNVHALLRASVNCIPYDLRRAIRHLPGIAVTQRWLVNYVMAGKPFLHTINAGPAAGLHFEVTLPIDKAVWSGTYEPEFTAALVGVIRPGDVCYDVGGYRGYISGVMALAGAARVLVFEPLPANQRAVERLCELNPDLPIDVRHVALGQADGSIALQIMADPSMAKLATSQFQPDALPVDQIEVRVARLDALVGTNEIPPPDVIKIDVEGAELDVLKGASAVLATYRPRICLEAHSDTLEQGCTRELRQAGYHITRLEDDPGGAEETRHLICIPK